MRATSSISTVLLSGCDASSAQTYLRVMLSTLDLSISNVGTSCLCAEQNVYTVLSAWLSERVLRKCGATTHLERVYQLDQRLRPRMQRAAAGRIGGTIAVATRLRRHAA